MIQQFDYFNYPETPQLVLCKVNRQEIGELKLVYDVNYELNLSTVNTLSFTYPKTVDGTESPFYSYLESKSVIYFLNIGYFIVKTVDISNDGIREEKKIECLSYEAILGKKNLVLVEGTYELYNILTPSTSLLGMIVDSLKGWSIGTVDSALYDKWRSFDVVDQSIYNFLMNDVMTSYECLITFDTINKRINAKALENVGVSTNIFLSHDNLIKECTVDESGDEIVTALACIGASELTVNRVNPNGTMYQYNFDYYKNTKYISQGLIDKLNSYESLYNSLQPTYANYLTSLNTKNNELVTLNTQLTTLEGELTTLEAQLVVKIQQSASLTSTNALIASKQSEINTKESQISDKENEIDGITASLDYINNQLNFENYFTSSELIELEEITYYSTYQDESFLITDSMTESEKQDVAQSLFDQCTTILERVSQPKLVIDVSVVDFIKLPEFATYTSQLNVGDMITVEYSEGLYYNLRLLTISHSWGDSDDLNLTFANKYKRYDGTYNIQEMLNGSLNTSTSLSYNAADYANWSSTYKNEVTTFINSALNAATNNIKSNDGQEILIDGNGIRGRKKLLNGSYDPKQLWIVNNMIAMSNDGFSTSKMMLGDYNGNFGLVADFVVGTLVAGNSLTITNSNNKFLVNSSGATLTDATLSVTNSTNKSRVLIDPTNGIKIQSNATGTWLDKFYADTNGNVVFSGALQGASGSFSGSISASTFTGGSITIGSRFSVDSLGNMSATNATFSGNINGGTISIGGKFYVDSLGNLTATSGTFTNGIINGSTAVNVTTNMNIGNMLYISKNNFSSGIRWANLGTSGTASDPEIYIDPNTETMFIEAGGGVYINGNQFVPSTGDITAVVAGAGLVGGGTSGSVTLGLDLNTTDDRYARNASSSNTYAVTTRSTSTYQDLSIAASSTGITIRSGSTVLGSIAYA